MTVRVPDEVRERVVAVAAATRRSQGDVVREALERALGDLEWEQRIAARAADYRSGQCALMSGPRGTVYRQFTAAQTVLCSPASTEHGRIPHTTDGAAACPAIRGDNSKGQE